MTPVIVTHTGCQFPLAEPDPAKVRVADIACALSRLPRFTGHTLIRWTVAQHSLLCHHLAAAFEPDVPLYALLHDAAEAYIGDLSTPLKALVPEIRAIEDRIQRAILEHLRLPPPPPHVARAVHTIDQVARVVEQRCLMPPMPPDADADAVISMPLGERLIDAGMEFIAQNRFGTARHRNEAALAKRFERVLQDELRAGRA
jgi:hypothetical protein